LMGFCTEDAECPGPTIEPDCRVFKSEADGRELLVENAAAMAADERRASRR
jgi:hypothetical protein